MKKNIKFNAVLNMLRQIFNMLLPLFTIPYVTRILENEEYGKISFAKTWVSYFTLIASLGISEYAIRECSRLRRNKIKLFRLSSEIYTINFISMIASYVLLICSLFIPKIGDYSTYIGILGTGIFFKIISVEWLCAVFEDFAFLTARTILMRLLSLVLIFSLVKTSGDSYIYCLILAGSECLEFLFNAIYIRKQVQVRLTKHPNVRRHINPIAILFGNSVIQTIYVSSDVTILGLLSTDINVSIYSLAVNVYSIVKSVTNAFNSVVLARLSFYLEDKDELSYECLVGKAFNGLIMIIGPILIGMFMMSKEVVFILGGKKYSESVICLKLLCVALLFSTIGSFLYMQILIPKRREKNILSISIISSAINIILNFVFMPRFMHYAAAFTTIIAELIVMIMSFYYSTRVTHIEIDKKDLITVVVGMVSIIICCCWSDKISLGFWHKALVKVLTSVFFYIFVLIIMQNSIIMEYVDSLIRRFNNGK